MIKADMGRVEFNGTPMMLVEDCMEIIIAIKSNLLEDNQTYALGLLNARLDRMGIHNDEDKDLQEISAKIIDSIEKRKEGLNGRDINDDTSI